jgi:hypothetical protein
MTTDDLDGLLATAARRPPPSEALMERVLADALALQPQPAPSARGLPRARPGVLMRLAGGVRRGARAGRGSGTAAVFGLALGYYSPATLDYLTGASCRYGRVLSRWRFPDDGRLKMMTDKPRPRRLPAVPATRAG